METWYTAQKDFFKLLANDNIYKELQDAPLSGKANYYNSYGLFIQKVFKVNSKNFLSVKLKLNYGTKLHSITLNGTTNSEHFRGSYDYYYSKENLISNGKTESSNPKGIGYGVDIEYIYNSEKIYFYLGGFNLGSYIYWDNVSLMHYDLDSDVIYQGDDGFNHYKPFGEGYYEYDVSFKQRLPQYYKTAFSYEVTDSLSTGYELNIYENMYFNKPYINYKYEGARYELAYIYENRELLFAAYFKYAIFEISNNFGPSNTFLRSSLKVSF